jgi:transcriptional antiterminator RfaH
MLKEWFILQYKSNSHYKAVRNLNQQGYTTFLPLNNFTSRKNSRFVRVSQPLFPGYMFISLGKNDTLWSKINNTYGVSRLITFNSILKPVPINFITNLMNRCDNSGKLISSKQLKKGDQIKILNGPFTNFIATVETLEADQRISVLMDLMGRKAKIKTDINNIQLSD